MRENRSTGSPGMSSQPASFPSCGSSLETPRLWLRAPTRADLPQIQRYAVRKDFYRYLDMEAPTAESVARYLDDVISGWEELHGTERVFAIEPKEAGRIAGLIRIGIEGEDSKQGNVGYSLDCDFQGRGYATEALKEVVRLGFEDLGLRRIWATVDTRNEKSRGVLERAGFQREDRMSAHRIIRGAPADSYLYATSNAPGLIADERLVIVLIPEGGLLHLG